MKKTLKFPGHYIQAVLSQDTRVTTRLFDEKDIAVGDNLSFLEKETGRCFASAEVIKVEQMPFEEMIKDAVDKEGMYAQYREYYQKPIDPSTPVKAISYRLTERMPS